jgi:hypothetical protein
MREYRTVSASVPPAVSRLRNPTFSHCICSDALIQDFGCLFRSRFVLCFLALPLISIPHDYLSM